jgi:hypothetical protein
MFLLFLLGSSASLPILLRRFRDSLLSIPDLPPVPLSTPIPDPDGDSSDSDGDNEQIPAEEPDSGPNEKFITLVVLISIFGVFVIVILAICCAKRTAIGKPQEIPVDPLQQWSTGAMSYTGTEALSQFTLGSDIGTRDNRIDL